MKIKPKKAESIGGVIVDYTRATFRYRRKTSVDKVNEIVTNHVARLMDEESKGVAFLVLELQHQMYKDVRELVARVLINTLPNTPIKAATDTILGMIDNEITKLREDPLLGKADDNKAEAIPEPRIATP